MSSLFYFYSTSKYWSVKQILLIEDDVTFSTIISSFLKKKGFEVKAVSGIQKGLEELKNERFDLLLLDYRLPDGNGLELIREMGGEIPFTPTIIITGFNDVRTAVKSIQSGAFEYIIKPVNPDELMMVIQAALRKKIEVRKPEPSVSQSIIQGESKVSKKLYEHVKLVAPTELSVMIIGESGTGKEHIARSIHDQSNRAGQPFVAVDCGVLSKDLAGSELFGHVKGAFTGALTDKKGLMEEANGGTLFLDEIGNLSYDVQVKLLRVIQERIIQPLGSSKTIPVDIRLITATNENLMQKVEEGDFREDIYHRINGFKIQMPPLRERGTDLDLFIAHFIQMANSELNREVQQVSPEALATLKRYDWPGNLRELKNVINRMVLLSTSTLIGPELIPDEMLFALRQQEQETDLKQTQESTEREMIIQVLEQTRYNKSKAARLLNIDRKTLYNKMEKYEIDG